VKITTLDEKTLRLLPDSKDAIAKILPEVDRLPDDSPKGCPCKLGEVRRYLEAETGRTGHDLFFGRTARIAGVQFWLWGAIDDGESVFIDVSQCGAGGLLAMGAAGDLSPEQYLLLRFVRSWRDKVLGPQLGQTPPKGARWREGR